MLKIRLSKLCKNSNQLRAFNGKMIIRALILFLILCQVDLNAQNQPFKVACVGNSITEGYGIFNSSSYPNQLDTLLGDYYDVRNFGVSGRTMLKNGDYPYWDMPLFTSAKNFNPDIVIILLGTNDSKPQNWQYSDEFYPDYMDMISEFRRNGRNPVIYASYPPPAFAVVWGIDPQIIQNEILPLIDSVRTTANTLSIDFFNPMLGLGHLFPDHIHPNAQGYRVMSEIAAQTILDIPSGWIRRFYATKTVVEEGQSSTLYWEVSDSSNVLLNGSPVSLKDSMVVNITQTTDYTLIASGEHTDTTVITIEYLPSGTIKSFNAFPPILELGINDSSMLSWETSLNSSVTLDGNIVNPNDSQAVSPDSTITYTLIANGVTNDTSTVTINVLNASMINRAQYADSIWCSSTLDPYEITNVYDNDTTTYWQSNGTATEWFEMDLGMDIYVNRVKIIWGGTYATTYYLMGVDSDNNVLVFHGNTSGDGGIDDITAAPVKTKILKLLCMAPSSTVNGYQVKEVEIYGSTSFPVNIEKVNNNIPGEFNLFQNYPNPFNPETTISFDLPKTGNKLIDVNLSIYNILGQKIITLIDKPLAAKSYKYKWDGKNAAGRSVHSGIYFYLLKADNHKSSKKMILIR